LLSAAARTAPHNEPSSPTPGGSLACPSEASHCQLGPLQFPLVPTQARRSSEFDEVSFENPPVNEVALAAYFPSETVDVQALASFSREVRSELPDQQSQPVLPPVVETFDTPPQMPSIQIQVGGATTFPRMWFTSPGDAQLVQIQHDRLTLNWRDLEQGLEYPRYDTLRMRFLHLLERLVAALTESGRPTHITLCEVTYVNPIEDIAHPGPGGTAGHPDLSHIVNRVRDAPRAAFLQTPEDMQLQARWRIPGGDGAGQEGAPVGRLYASAIPAVKAQVTPLYILTLVARVFPVGGDVPAAMGALDLGHRWVVRGFKDLTTAEMHAAWGLVEDGT
jgi:uncharacterized protein (TIGR04255 family)